jgi:hypothetical protein
MIVLRPLRHPRRHATTKFKLRPGRSSVVLLRLGRLHPIRARIAIYLTGRSNPSLIVTAPLRYPPKRRPAHRHPGRR